MNAPSLPNHVTVPHLDPAQAAFQMKVRALLDAPHVVQEVREVRSDPARVDAGALEVYRELGREGWLAVHWPVEFGGQAGTPVDKAIVTRELIAHHVPDLAHVVSIDIVGQVLLEHGSAVQKEQYLPGLAAGTLLASVLYSEPGVGSDLASLRTRAVADEDGWRLYGRKLYSLKSHLADVALCAARTSSEPSPMQGITLFLVPLKAPGVFVEPVPSISDDAFSDVTLDGIRVTREDVVGEVDEGWDLLTTVLPIERTAVEFETKAALLLHRLLERAATGGRDLRTLPPELGDFDASVRAAGLMSQQCVRQLAAGELDATGTAVAKLHATETHKALTRSAYDVLGGAGTAPDPADDLATLLDHAHRDSPGFTLSAGTSEIMLQLITATVLEEVGSPEWPLAADADRSPGLAGILESVEAMTDPELRPVLARLAPGEETWQEASSTVVAWLDEAPRPDSRTRTLLTQRLEETLLPSAVGQTLLARHLCTLAGLDAEVAVPRGTTAAVAWPGPDTPRPVSSPDSPGLTGRFESVPAEGVSWLVVVAPGPDATLRLAVVPAGDPSVHRHDRGRIDDRERIVLDLDGVAPTHQGGRWSAAWSQIQLAQAARLSGLARAGHRMSLARAATRRQFGRRIGDFQAVGFALASERVALTVLDTLLADAAERLDDGSDAAVEVTQTLVRAAEVARDVTARVVQVHGAEGMRQDHDAQLVYRRATVEAVALGTVPGLRAQALRGLLERHDDGGATAPR